jgi:hypothetical protein
VKLVRYLVDVQSHGKRAGETLALDPRTAASLERDGLAVIIDHPMFRHPGAREFAGLPPPIEPPREPRAKRKS